MRAISPRRPTDVERLDGGHRRACRGAKRATRRGTRRRVALWARSGREMGAGARPAARARARLGGRRAGGPRRRPADAAAEPDRATLYGLAQTGELWTHAWATLWRVAVGFGLGAVERHRARGAVRHERGGAPPPRSDPPGAAGDPVDRLGAAVHPVARDLRGLEGGADRGRRVLPGLSRRRRRHPLRRPQARRGRPRVPPLAPRPRAADPAAGGAAGGS